MAAPANWTASPSLPLLFSSQDVRHDLAIESLRPQRLGRSSGRLRICTILSLLQCCLFRCWSPVFPSCSLSYDGYYYRSGAARDLVEVTPSQLFAPLLPVAERQIPSPCCGWTLSLVTVLVVRRPNLFSFSVSLFFFCPPGVPPFPLLGRRQIPGCRRPRLSTRPLLGSPGPATCSLPAARYRLSLFGP
jgi:hypothetical protein